MHALSPARRKAAAAKRRELEQLERHVAAHRRASPTYSPSRDPLVPHWFSRPVGSPSRSAAARLAKKSAERKLTRLVSKLVVKRRFSEIKSDEERDDLAVTAAVSAPLAVPPPLPPIAFPAPCSVPLETAVYGTEYPMGNLEALPTHLFLQVLASGFLAPRDLEAIRRSCKAFAEAHPSSQLDLALPCEAARMMLMTDEHSRVRDKCAALLSGRSTRRRTPSTPSVDSVCAAGGVGATPCDDSKLDESIALVNAGTFWIDKLERVLAVPHSWASLANAIERRVYHRSQLVTWAQRFTQLRQQRARENLASLVRRSAEFAERVATRRRTSEGGDPE